MDQIVELKGTVKIGGMVSLDALSQHPLIREKYAVLAEAAHAVGRFAAFGMQPVAVKVDRRAVMQIVKSLREGKGSPAESGSAPSAGTRRSSRARKAGGQ
jgi:hypothetical protein